MNRRAAVVVLGFGLVACGTRAPRPEQPDDDVIVGELDGSLPLSASDAVARLGQPCPSGAVARGWYRDRGVPSLAVWCEDARGLLHGRAIVSTKGSTWTGHYRDGIADGGWFGPAGGAVYANGLLHGPCTFDSGMLTYRAGIVDGPFAFRFGDDPCDVITRGCTGWPSAGECREANPNPDVGSVSGTFVAGVAETIVVRRHGLAREVALDEGVAIELPELADDPPGAAELFELLGPAHRWAGVPRCRYQNDTTLHRPQQLLRQIDRDR